MEREEIERVERELDAILKLVQPEPTMQDKTREEALSEEPVPDGDKKTSEDKKTYGADSGRTDSRREDRGDLRSRGAGGCLPEECTLEEYLFGEAASEAAASRGCVPVNDRPAEFASARYASGEYSHGEHNHGEYSPGGYASDNYASDDYASDEYTSEEDEYGMEEENETAGQDR